jgi:nondiscriminating glutamyl-tRNA synthetase
MADGSSNIRVRFAPSPTDSSTSAARARRSSIGCGRARTAASSFCASRTRTKAATRRPAWSRSSSRCRGSASTGTRARARARDEALFYQSNRRAIYNEHLDRLAKEGKIYPAFETSEELDEKRKLAEQEKRNPMYDRASLRLSPAEVQAKLDAGTPFVWRFKVPEGHTDVPETLMGDDAECHFDNSAIDDFVVTRRGTMGNPGMPLYNFCCVVDDAQMGITNVIRGVEHLSNAARQVLLYHAFGYPVPTFTHLPLIMKNGKKMSKRDDDPLVSVSERRRVGYLREALINFFALLGWSHPEGKDHFPVEETLQLFNLDRLNKANPSFDEKKLLHMNGWYIRNLPRETVIGYVKPFMAEAGCVRPDKDDAWLAAVVSLEIERCQLLSEFPDALRYFFEAPTSYEEKGAKKFFAGEEAAAGLELSAKTIAACEPFAHDALEAKFRELSEASGIGLGKIAQPIRLALTGRTASPPLFDVVALLGREETLARIARAVEFARKQ